MKITERNVQRLAYDMKGIVEDLDGLLRGIPQDLNEEGRKARQRLEGALQSAKDSCQLLENRTLAGLRATDEAVHEKPYAFLGAAFGVGLLIGVLTCRR